MFDIWHGDCSERIESIKASGAVIVTDPPFNIGYHYNSYVDRMPEDEYYRWLASILGGAPCAVVHYPESLYILSAHLGLFPNRVVSWCYNSNTAKQHRDIAFFDIEPDFKQVRQPYKNLNDKRIKERIKNGSGGGRLYDWWVVNQVKNVSREKTAHPCQMPLEVMERIIGILPKDTIVCDPFMGSGTTGVAVMTMNRKQNASRRFVGIEIDGGYYEIAKERINATYKENNNG